MSRVFVIQRQIRRNRETGEMEPTYDIEPATDYGSLVYVLEHEDSPHQPAAVVKKLRERLTPFTPEDYLLLIGNPCLIGWATALVAQQTGGLVKQLLWNGKSQSYLPVIAHIFDS